jgi:hypothetical protein
MNQETKVGVILTNGSQLVEIHAVQIEERMDLKQAG